MIDEAFQTGYQAINKHPAFLSNPYKDGSREARRYIDGLVQAIIDKRLKNECAQ